MRSFKTVSNNDLSECQAAINEVLRILKNDYLHIAHFLQSDIDKLEATQKVIIDEGNKREDQF